MCFHNLPIEFDQAGKALLRKDAPAADPFGVSRTKVRQIVPKKAPVGPTKELHIAPVTRIAGAMAFHATVDLKSRAIIDAHSSAEAFRGYELVLRERDPLESMDISSRACGVCGGVHATTSSLALDMAIPISPPLLGIVTRNLVQAIELIYDHPLHMFLLAGPDYSEQAVAASDPDLWAKATRTAAPNAKVHGLKTLGEIMTALNPLAGSLYVETFSRTRVALKMYAKLAERYPHPQTMVPGGINVLLDETHFRYCEENLANLYDYAKRIVLVYDDLMNFFLQANPENSKVGLFPNNLLCFGRYDDPAVYDGSFAKMNEWGNKRQVPPGAVVNGQLRTTRLSDINLGVEEFVEHSYYENWKGDLFKQDPAGNPLSPFHPWNKTTNPKPVGQNWREKYTWATSPRWDREVMEVGPIARNWIYSLAGKPLDGLVQPTATGLEFTIPKGQLPEMKFVWNRPQTINAFTRNLARAYHLGFSVLVALNQIQQALKLLKAGESRVWEKHPQPSRGIGVGFWEAARGALAHWIVLEEGRVANYQIITPSSWNVSPRDPWDNPGPYEVSVLNSPITEKFKTEADFKGIDILRAIRSYDPCMPCAVHMDTGTAVVTREVNSCPCTLEE